jgi:plasmid stability protein
MPQDSPSRHLDQYLVRFPEGMRDQIKAHAAANGRSMNSEIVSLLNMALWYADMGRMDSGMEPLREMTDSDREYLALQRKGNDRRETMKTQSLPADLPFLSGDLELTEEEQAQAAEELETYVEELAQLIAKKAIRKTLSLKRPGKISTTTTEKPAEASQLGPVRLTGRLGQRKLKLDD